MPLHLCSPSVNFLHTVLVNRQHTCDCKQPTTAARPAQARPSLAPAHQAALGSKAVAAFQGHQILKTLFLNLNTVIFYLSELQQAQNIPSMALPCSWPRMPSGLLSISTPPPKERFKVSSIGQKEFPTVFPKRTLLESFSTLKIAFPILVVSWSKYLCLLFAQLQIQYTRQSWRCAL